MGARRSKQVEPLQRALARVEELERRVTQVEARLRQALATANVGAAKRGKGEVERAGRARPRCPGCTLELPRGRRAETCVWCGFRLDAVRGLLR